MLWCAAGPTNSGKTYTALQALRAAGSGMYCGPLRLLALEVADTMNDAGATGGVNRSYLSRDGCGNERVNVEACVSVCV